MKGARIRSLNPEDYDFIIGRVDDWLGGREMSEGLPRFFFDHFSATSLVAEDEQGRIVAFLSGFMSPDRSKEAYIHYAAVDPALKGRGIGSRIYRAFFETALSKGRSTVRCSTSPVNRGSIAFHQKTGFELVDSPHYEDGIPVHPDYNGPGRHKVLFIKNLLDRN